MLKEMTYIYTVYRERSFSRAAKKLFITQPALSTAVRRTEEALGCQLFDRKSTPLEPTAAGRFYIACAEEIFAVKERMDDYFRELSRKQRGTVAIGSSTYCCTYVLPRLIQEFESLHPEISVSLSEAASPELLKKVKSGALDLMLDAGSTGDPEAEEQPFTEDRLILAVPADFVSGEEEPELRRLALPAYAVKNGEYRGESFPAVSPARFAKKPFLFLRPGNDLYTRGLSVCAHAGFEPRIDMYVDQMMTAYYLACEGRGISFIRDTIILHAQPSSRIYLFKLDDPLAVRHLVFSHRKAVPLSPAARLFLEYVMIPGANSKKSD